MGESLSVAWESRLAKVDYAFQPVVNIHTGVCYGFEALIRGVDKAGFDSIAAFFDRAHEDRVLLLVHRDLCERAARKFKGVSDANRLKLFINLDSRLFSEYEVQPEVAARLIVNQGLCRDAVCFEISERHEIQRQRLLPDKLRYFRVNGFRLAIDDFGIGFAGLRLLYYVRPDFIKIDRFFIQDIEKDGRKQILAASIVKIAHLIGSVVIAEGVETEKEYYCCKKIGCDLIQGYLIQEPGVDVRHMKSTYEIVGELSARDRRGGPGKDREMLQHEMEYIDPIRHDASLLEVLDCFRKNGERSFFPVVRANQEAIGIIREARIKEFAYSKYGRSLLANPTFIQKIDDFIDKIPNVDINMPVEEILETFSTNDDLKGILISNSMRYVGFLRAQSLLRILSEKNLSIARDMNPLSRLPGNNLIYEYVSRALQDISSPYALIYFDFDNFKAYNDTYGFRQGDRVILLFAELLKARGGAADHFVGHVGGDDFFMGVKGRSLERCTAKVCRLADVFRRDVESFYNHVDKERGFIEAKDRSGRPCRFPLITVSSVVIHLPEGIHRILSPEEIGERMAKLKKEAKKSDAKMAVASLEHFESNPGAEVISIRRDAPSREERAAAIGGREC